MHDENETKDEARHADTKQSAQLKQWPAKQSSSSVPRSTHFLKRFGQTEDHSLAITAWATCDAGLQSLIPPGSAGTTQPFNFECLVRKSFDLHLQTIEWSIVLCCMLKRIMSHVKSSLSQDSVKDLIKINDTDQIEDFNARETVHSWQDEVQKVNQNHGTPPKILIYTFLNGQQLKLDHVTH